MSENINWVLGGLALLAGCTLGAFFFGGLWWTVQRGASSKNPARWFISSLILRIGIVLSGFYLIGASQLLYLGFCMLGFLLARTVVLRITGHLPTATAPAMASPPGNPPCA